MQNIVLILTPKKGMHRDYNDNQKAEHSTSVLQNGHRHVPADARCVEVRVDVQVAVGGPHPHPRSRRRSRPPLHTPRITHR